MPIETRVQLHKTVDALQAVKKAKLSAEKINQTVHEARKALANCLGVQVNTTIEEEAVRAIGEAHMAGIHEKED